MGIEAKLARSMAAVRLVRIERSLRFADPVDGFVIQVGTKWVLVAKVSDGGYFDGHVALRIRDIERVKANRSFASVHVLTEPEWPPGFPRPVGLDDTAVVLRDLDASDSLIGIQNEQERSAIWIGRLDEILGKWVYLREVRTDASWHESPLGYKLKSITSVEIGTRYLVALAQVAGAEPPPN